MAKYKTQATFENYTIGVKEDNSVEILIDGELCTGVLVSILRNEIAPKVGFKVDPSLNVRRLGKKLVDYINSMDGKPMPQKAQDEEDEAPIDPVASYSSQNIELCKKLNEELLDIMKEAGFVSFREEFDEEYEEEYAERLRDLASDGYVDYGGDYCEFEQMPFNHMFCVAITDGDDPLSFTRVNVIEDLEYDEECDCVRVTKYHNDEDKKGMPDDCKPIVKACPEIPMTIRQVRDLIDFINAYRDGGFWEIIDRIEML